MANHHHPHSLLTDLYQLTMAFGYWADGRAEDEAVFHLFYRKAPFGAQCVLAGGIAPAAELIEAFGVDEEGLQYLATLEGNGGTRLFPDEFLEWLGGLGNQLTVDAVEEGEVVFPHQPILRVKGPLALCQLLETPLLNLINFQTLIATKAARICEAAEGDTVLEFGLRRAQGPDGAMSASRAAYLGGVDATSNVLAGKEFGIPVKGTHAHSWVMAYEDEQDAFDTYAKHLPNNTLLLVDTYDTVKGVEKAIVTAKALRENGHELLGVRLDSGDLAALSREARRMLDDAGLKEARIVASNDLDEYRIAELKQAGAKIDTWGIGTRLVTAYDQPALGGVFKLASIRPKGGEWRDCMKRSEDLIKRSIPGHLETLRYRNDQGLPMGDVIVDARAKTKPETVAGLSDGTLAELPEGDPAALLKPLFDKGRRVREADALPKNRERAMRNRREFAAHLMGTAPEYPNLLEGELANQRNQED